MKSKPAWKSQPARLVPRLGSPLAALGLAFCLSSPALHADERAFTYSYEAVSVLPKGGVELEQWITYRAGKEDGRFTRWDLREEIEFGVTDRYTTALYLNFSDIHSEDVHGPPTPTTSSSRAFPPSTNIRCSILT